MLGELCRVCGYHCTHAIRKLNQALRQLRPRMRIKRGPIYPAQTPFDSRSGLGSGRESVVVTA